VRRAHPPSRLPGVKRTACVEGERHELSFRQPVHADRPRLCRRGTDLPAGFADTLTSRFIDTGEVRLHAVIGGEGPPVLLVHGWPQTWYAWRMVMPVLARDFEVIAVDQRADARSIPITILEAADELDVALIVIGSRGLGGVRALIAQCSSSRDSSKRSTSRPRRGLPPRRLDRLRSCLS
jgi:hypothetical protein